MGRRYFWALLRVIVTIKNRFGVLLLCIAAFLILFVHFYSLHTQMDETQYVQTDVTVIGWESGKSRNVMEYILPNNLTTVINNNQICNASNPPYILLAVCSNIRNYSLRLAIRNTWAFAAYQKYNISVFFLLGLSNNQTLNDQIKLENEIFNDIVVEDFLDTYNNLTLKTMMMLKWVKHNCNNTPYVMKTDDDTYVNLISVLNLVYSISERRIENLLIGQLLCAAKPIADPSHKWYMPHYMYSSKIYPNYLSGVGYFMSTKAALHLYNQAFYIPLLHMEDVFTTGICASVVGMTRFGHKFFDYKDPGYARCTSEDVLLVTHSHRLSSRQMYETHYIVSECNVPENQILNVSHLSSKNQSSNFVKIHPKNQRLNEVIRQKYQNGLYTCSHAKSKFKLW